MTWKAFKNKILIEPISADQTVGGLFIPDTSSTLKKGLVISAGEGDTEPMAVKEGEIVLYEKDSATPITLDDKQYVLIRENDVWMRK
jgi:chaperonin GroES